MSWTFCTSGQAIVKAGANANSTITASNQALADWSDEIEALICSAIRYDAVTNYGNLTTNGKKLFQMISSSHIAQQIVDYDLGVNGSRKSETILDVQENQVKRGLQLLEDADIKTYLTVSPI